jgi:thiosulfate/3-mercaptopyruvate sulfurtransferase
MLPPRPHRPEEIIRMAPTLSRRQWLALTSGSALALALPPALRAQTAGTDELPPGPLVQVSWLAASLGRADLVVLDASMPQERAGGHVPGAIAVDGFGLLAGAPAPEVMERRLRAWGIGPQSLVVLLDGGGSWIAPRLFYDLLRHGVVESRLKLLDGGLAAWRAAGAPLTREPTPAPASGSFRLGALRDAELRVRFDEFLLASGTPSRVTLLDALEPDYYYGGARFFSRGGHVPNAVLAPASEFFGADKRFKPAAELAQLAAHLGLSRERPVFTHCGGGGAAAVPWFALRVLLGWPQVRLYQESHREWLSDERGLPFWTWADPNRVRDAAWLSSWGGGMLRQMGLARVAIVDLRPEAAFAQGHPPGAVSLPAAQLPALWREPQRLADRLAAAGVDPTHEAVVVSAGGLNPASALAVLALERAGQRRASVLLESVDEWALRGLPLVKPSPAAASPARPLSVRQLAADAAAGAGYPAVSLRVDADTGTAAGAVSLPWTALVAPDGALRPAHEAWTQLRKAGLPRLAQVTVTAREPGEGAVALLVLRMLGWPDTRAAF